MIATTFNAEPVYVVNHAPNWTTKPVLSFELPVVVETGLTGREYRTPLAKTLRATLTWTTTLQREGFNALRNALKAQADARVICPAWPFAVAGAGGRNTRGTPLPKLAERLAALPGELAALAEWSKANALTGAVATLKS